MLAFFSCVLWWTGGVNNPDLFPDIISFALFGLKLDVILAIGLVLIFAGNYVWHEKIRKDGMYSKK